MRKDESPRVPQRDKVKESLVIKQRYELNLKQKQILATALDKNTKCIMIDGLWGTSKTYLAVLASLQLLSEKKIDEIIYVRNPVESSVSGKMGYLKGDINDKLAPYTAPFEEKLGEFLAPTTIKKLQEDERVTSMALGFVRGRSFNCKAIIVDEAASMSFDDLLLILTRCGPFTKIFLIGDSENQNDIGNKSGFRDLFYELTDEESKEAGVFTFEMKNEEDIVRSDFVRFILKKVGKIKK